jgi:hypothetical protein
MDIFVEETSVADYDKNLSSAHLRKSQRHTLGFMKRTSAGGGVHAGDFDMPS